MHQCLAKGARKIPRLKTAANSKNCTINSGIGIKSQNKPFSGGWQ